MDTDYLIWAPLALLDPLLGGGPEWAFLRPLADRLAGRVEQAAPELKWGFCHGDLHHGNIVLAGRRLGLFDFEFCGVGFQACDLAVFRWILESHAPVGDSSEKTLPLSSR